MNWDNTDERIKLIRNYQRSIMPRKRTFDRDKYTTNMKHEELSPIDI